MTFFAGIVSRDGQTIPDAWISALHAHAEGVGYKCRTVNDGTAAFVATTEATGVDAQNGPLLFVHARIDNGAELYAQLGLAEPSAGDESDDAIVACAYQHWGEQCAEHLVGEFAVAVWDGSRRRLFVARDSLGLRPLYYYRSPSVVAIATELPALLALPFVTPCLSEELIADTLIGNGSGAPGRTFYEDIEMLPCGHTMIVEAEHHELTQYWMPARQPAIVLNTDDDYAAELRQRVTTAVECQLRGSRTPAVHLSGGLDSAGLACIAARLLRRRGRRLLALCSVLPEGYDGPEGDERAFIEAVLAQEDNIDVVWIQPEVRADVFGAHERWFDAVGEPPYSSVTHIEQLLGEAGQRYGVDVVLSGFAGDFFASWRGQNAIREIARSGRLALALRELRALRREQGGSWSQHLRAEVVAPLMPKFVRTLRSRPTNRTCVHPDLARRVDDRRGPRAKPTFLAAASPRDIMVFVLEPGHLERALPATVQVFAREFAQALRFPLIDRRVIELMLGVPPDQLQKDGWQRSLMRRAMRGIVPEVVRMRPDKGGAFDPAIISRIDAGRERLAEWAAATSARTCWHYVDRDVFLQELAAVVRAPRSQWRPQTFKIVVMGGLIARFVDWHERTYGSASP